MLCHLIHPTHSPGVGRQPPCRPGPFPPHPTRTHLHRSHAHNHPPTLRSHLCAPSPLPPPSSPTPPPHPAITLCTPLSPFSSRWVAAAHTRHTSAPRAGDFAGTLHLTPAAAQPFFQTQQAARPRLCGSSPPPPSIERPVSTRQTSWPPRPSPSRNVQSPPCFANRTSPSP
jgi:hypothetical protein